MITLFEGRKILNMYMNKSVKDDQMEKKTLNIFFKISSGALLHVGDITDKKRYHFTIFGVRKSQF